MLRYRYPLKDYSAGRKIVWMNRSHKRHLTKANKKKLIFDQTIMEGRFSQSIKTQTLKIQDKHNNHKIYR